MRNNLIDMALIEAAAAAGDNLAGVAANTLTVYDLLTAGTPPKERPDRSLKIAQLVAFAALLETELVRRYAAEAPR